VCGGCGPAVSFSVEILPIFTTNCTSYGCHQGLDPTAGLDLEGAQAWTQLVSVPSTQCGGSRVAPGSASASVLVYALTGSGCANLDRMPPGLEPVPDDQVDLARAWVCQGAPRN
jgi:hypothetical protein